MNSASSFALREAAAPTNVAQGEKEKRATLRMRILLQFAVRLVSLASCGVCVRDVVSHKKLWEVVGEGACLVVTCFPLFLLAGALPSVALFSEEVMGLGAWPSKAKSSLFVSI